MDQQHRKLAWWQHAAKSSEAAARRLLALDKATRIHAWTFASRLMLGRIETDADGLGHPLTVYGTPLGLFGFGVGTESLVTQAVELPELSEAITSAKRLMQQSRSSTGVFIADVSWDDESLDRYADAMGHLANEIEALMVAYDREYLALLDNIVDECLVTETPGLIQRVFATPKENLQ